MLHCEQQYTQQEETRARESPSSCAIEEIPAPTHVAPDRVGMFFRGEEGIYRYRESTNIVLVCLA